jgi:hypothetical protein
MGVSKLFKEKRLVELIAFLGWSIVFGIIYAQSPLFTSNQNRYFLEGLAHAGYGTLNNDWLVNTIDALPLFSLLVQVTYLVCQGGILYYFYYAILMGVYMVSIISIVDNLFQIRQSRNHHLIFITLFLGLHSAALHYIFSRVLGTGQPFLLEGGVASQRLLGQVLQPSVFGVFLVLSISLFLSGRHFLSLISLAIAVSFHSVYLLTAAFLVIGYMLLIFQDKKTLKDPIFFGVMALLLVMPVLIYTYYIFKPTSPEIAQEVNQILFDFRNPQHADISSWLDWTVAVQSVLVLAALFVVRKKHIFKIFGIVLLGILVLTFFQLITKSDTLALLYPWRMSVVLVPVSASILLAYFVKRIFNRLIKSPSKYDLWVNLSCITVLTILLCIGATRFQIETARRQAETARPIMEYVFNNKNLNDVYLVPVKMEDFRLAAGAPIYVDYKSIPYRDLDVQEWYRRFKLANLFFQREKCDVLTQVYQEGVTKVIIPVNFATKCDGLSEIYKDQYYSLYALTKE